VRATALDAAKACRVPFSDALAIDEVLLKVIVLAAAGLAGADGVEAFVEVEVRGAEALPAILAGIDHWLMAPAKSAGGAASRRSHSHLEPRS
jgi:hypothetical protein